MKYRKLVLLIAIGFVPLSNQQVAAPDYPNWHEELSDEAKELIDFISVCRYKSISAEPNVQEALCNGPHAPQGSWSATDGLECPSFPYKANWCVIDSAATNDAIQEINGSMAARWVEPVNSLQRTLELREAEITQLSAELEIAQQELTEERDSREWHSAQLGNCKICLVAVGKITLHPPTECYENGDHVKFW